MLDDPVSLGLYNANKDYVTEKASTKVDISPAFNRIPGPESSHTILAGSWDYKAMPLNKPPDFDLMGKAAILGGFGNVLDLAASASDPLGLVEKFTGARKKAKRLIATTKAEAEQVGKRSTSDSGGSGTGTGTGAGGCRRKDSGAGEEGSRRKSSKDKRSP